MKYEVRKFEPYNVCHVGELLLHIRCIHTRERPFQCSYCPKNFQRRDLLRKHERIHTDTRPYGCEFCGKTFTARDKMIVHRRLHTGELWIYIVTWELWSFKSPPLKRSIRSQVKQLDEFIAKKGMSNVNPYLKVELTRHRSIHMGEKNYQCSYCSMKFNRPDTLRAHERGLHTNTRPYACDFCSKTFTLRQKMLNHRRLHTGIQLSKN